MMMSGRFSRCRNTYRRRTPSIDAVSAKLPSLAVMNRRNMLAWLMSRPTIFGSYGSRASILPSVLISAIEPRSPSDRRENRFWKYSSRIDITATPPARRRAS